ncbi:MAG: hypothetical protein HWD60_11240 [Defluviicoccus sp.]|nr:MAG: hypothetical protein HWD60_11240 [Defluviicoccus sp.]
MRIDHLAALVMIRQLIETEEHQAELAALVRSGPDLADTGSDCDALRTAIRNKDATPVIPGRRLRKRQISFDKRRDKFRWMVEAVFCRRRHRRLLDLIESGP